MQPAAPEQEEHSGELLLKLIDFDTFLCQLAGGFINKPVDELTCRMIEDKMEKSILSLDQIELTRVLARQEEIASRNTIVIEVEVKPFICDYWYFRTIHFE